MWQFHNLLVEHVDTLKTVHGLLTELPDLPVRISPLVADVSVITSNADQQRPAPNGHTATPRRARQDAAAPAAGVWYTLALRAHQLRVTGATEDLIAPAVLAERLQPLAYQLRVVRQVLHEKAPAAILADEVGLGKTIEAGLVLKELRLRGIVRTALIVAPKALLAQWQEELRERFDEEFVLSEERRFHGFEHEERVICSFQQFVSAFGRIQPRVWDCLIVDEAHLLANPDAKRRRCAGELQAHWRLLLTATPVQNKISDLYSLVDLVAPGRLGTLRQFVAAYAADPATCRVVIPARVDELRALTDEVMCRTRRSDTDIAFAPRTVETYLVEPGAAEAALNRDVTSYLRALYRRGVADQPPEETPQRSAPRKRGRSAPAQAPTAQAPTALGASGSFTTRIRRGQLIREIVALQQSLSSSPQAIAVALGARAAKHPEEAGPLSQLAGRAEHLTSAKERLLLDAQRRSSDEPVLIFTLRLETARHLRQVFRQAGRKVECYIGELGSDERRALVTRFNRGELHALIATDAGAEGLNLQQRCHTVFNYDLHWNPMKMEQRIGRVHRLGQRHEVLVANFALRHSIDEYVLQLLYQKINLFTMTIGSLETVLADIQDGELDFEERILEALLQGDDTQDIRTQIEAIGAQMSDAAGQVSASQLLTVETLG